MVKGRGRGEERERKILGATCREDSAVETVLCRKYVIFPAFKFNNDIF